MIRSLSILALKACIIAACGVTFFLAGVEVVADGAYKLTCRATDAVTDGIFAIHDRLDVLEGRQ